MALSPRTVVIEVAMNLLPLSYFLDKQPAEDTRNERCRISQERYGLGRFLASVWLVPSNHLMLFAQENSFGVAWFTMHLKGPFVVAYVKNVTDLEGFLRACGLYAPIT